MSEDIVVPVLGESITEATVSKWLKKSGETVRVDEPVVELETDKVNLEVPSPINGVISEIKTKEGETVKVGTLLGKISESDNIKTKKIEKIKPKEPITENITKPLEAKSNVVNFEKNKIPEPKIFEEKEIEPLILTDEIETEKKIKHRSIQIYLLQSEN